MELITKIKEASKIKSALSPICLFLGNFIAFSLSIFWSVTDMVASHGQILCCIKLCRFYGHTWFFMTAKLYFDRRWHGLKTVPKIITMGGIFKAPIKTAADLSMRLFFVIKEIISRLRRAKNNLIEKN